MSRLPSWVRYVGAVLIIIVMLYCIWVMGSYVVEKIVEWMHRG